MVKRGGDSAKTAKNMANRVEARVETMVDIGAEAVAGRGGRIRGVQVSGAMRRE